MLLHRRLPAYVIIPLSIFLAGMLPTWSSLGPGGEKPVDNLTANLLLGYTPPPRLSPSGTLVPTPKPVDCSFFWPDDEIYETIQMSLERGLQCIQSIEEPAEEIFLIMPAGNQVTFLDVGAGSHHSSDRAWAEFNPTDLVDYLAQNLRFSNDPMLFTHNHPQFEGQNIVPPTFNDLAVLSNLKALVNERKLRVSITGLVVQQGVGLWHFYTLAGFEADVMNPLREALEAPATKQSANRIYSLFLKNLYGWSKIRENYPDDPAKISAGMREKGVAMDYYETVTEFLEALDWEI
jgi:hypothetical protein